MISFTYNNTPFLFCIILYSISRCSALNNCGPFNGYNAVFYVCDGQTINSSGDVRFQLGFFTPNGSLNKNRYVGIWYLTNPETVVWVANRDNPLPENSKGSFGVQNDDGNLQLFDEKGIPYFSTKLDTMGLRKVNLLESGNLVLTDEIGNFLWQSFENPTDTFLPGMKMSGNIKLTSWKSGQDPSPGIYRFEQNEDGQSKYTIIVNGTIKYWKSGAQSSNFNTDNKIYDLAGYLLDNYNPVINMSKATGYLNRDFNKTRLVISWSGEIQYFRISNNGTSVKVWSEPQTPCNVYNRCGNFGFCTTTTNKSEIRCNCLPEFEPVVNESWYSGDYLGGCRRKSNLCTKEANYTYLPLKVTKIKDPDYQDTDAKDESICKIGCFNNCRCQAYFYRNQTETSKRNDRTKSGNGCFVWQSDLADIHVGNGTNQPTISIKVANSITGFYVRDGQTINSSGDVRFQLGFFTPNGSLNKNRYVGIWYLTSPETVVWVANRDHPLPENSKGLFGLQNGDDGNLRLIDEKGNSYFSTNLGTPKGLRKVSFLESGNLVLTNERGTNILWQSFGNPTDTFLPGMKMSENIKLTSWKSGEDPSTGNYRFEQNENEPSRYTVFVNGTMEYWKSGAQSRNFTTALLLLHNNSVTQPPYSNGNSTGYRNPNFNKSRLVISSTGEIQYFRILENGTSVKVWAEPQTPFDVYNPCGYFGICSSNKSKIMCDCLDGFEPQVKEKWDSGNYVDGCIRKTSLCTKEENYTYFPLTVIKIKDHDHHDTEANNESMCKTACLNDCGCQAYSYRNETRTRSINEIGTRIGNDCYLWRSELEDIHVGNATDQFNISIKVANSTTGSSASVQNPQNKSISGRVVIIIIVSSMVAFLLFLCSLSYIYHRKMVAKSEESRKDIIENIAGGSNSRQLTEEEKGNIDVPFFDLKTILAATDSFSDANKLGEGGFGPVYKGTFPGGQEIAVKRLSVHSMQGMDELKNEVVLIARLQHRNLVRLLGYCIEGNENILLYEYMPNKSLDAFIFDEKLCVLLNWEKRFEIILGIARGLLYLHQDSRLRIIHRDLKASNVLLDEDMNPKISDFGLARIVGGRDTAANTNRIVGTYGYMSPEYALEGLFSIKSDVFSFGVVMLEIISGKKNTGFYRSLHDLNLLGYAWRLWKERNALAIMDEKIAECCNKSEVLKCITIALLCIQEDPSDRPNMSNIVIMLGSTDIENIGSPKRPAFVTRTNEKILSNKELTHSHQEFLSNNEVTLSIVKPR